MNGHLFSNLSLNLILFLTHHLYSLLRYICPLDRMATEEMSFCLHKLLSALFSMVDTHYIVRKKSLKVNPFKTYHIFMVNITEQQQ